MLRGGPRGIKNPQAGLENHQRIVRWENGRDIMLQSGEGSLKGSTSSSLDAIYRHTYLLSYLREIRADASSQWDNTPEQDV